MKDREALLPNRRKITYDDGSYVYATIEFADQPSVDGTLLNKSNLLSDDAVLEMALSQSDPVPSDAFIALKRGAIQYPELPTASITYLGSIVIYTGETDVYTHGHIYECISSGGESPTYSWEEIVLGDPFSVSYNEQTISDSQKTQARTNVDAAKAVGGVADAIEAAVLIDPYTDDVTIGLSNIGHDVYITSSSNKSVTIPPQSSVSFVANSYFFFTRGGTGTLAIVAGSGVTVHSAGNRLKIAEQYGTLMVRRISEDVWEILTGSTSA